jgi:hypothetical protein
MADIVLGLITGTKYSILLSFNNFAEYFIIPVLPESIEVKEDGNGKTYDIVGEGGGSEETRAGEINVIKNPRLREISFTSTFPAQWYPFVMIKPNYLKTPSEYIEMIRKWRETKRPIRFIFTGSRHEIITANDRVGEQGSYLDYDINIPASIEDFTWKEVAGSPGDIEYTLKLKEYVFYSARKVRAVTLVDGNVVTVTDPPARPDERIRPETVMLKESDSLLRSLMSVAMRYYNTDSSRMKDIQKLNGFSDAAMKRPVVAGTIIKLPQN